MTRHLLISVLVAGCVAAFCCSAADASDWVFRQARYTHDPVTGERVTQYAPEAPVYAPVDPTYRQSGQIFQNARFRNASGSVDRVQVRQQWGYPWCWGYDTWYYGQGDW